MSLAVWRWWCLVGAFAGLLACRAGAGDKGKGAVPPGEAADRAKPQTFTVPLKAAEKKEIPLRLLAGRRVQLRVLSEEDSNVDLYVFGPRQKLVASDTRVSKDCEARFTPEATETYRIVLLNLGPKPNRSTLTVDQIRIAQRKPFDLKGRARKQFAVTFSAGQLAEVWVESEKDTDVDLFVRDPGNKSIASDTRVSKDCYVKFLPAKTQEYLLEVYNLGPGDNRCRLKFTLDKAKQ
jgi:hypothetical protein